MTRAGTSERLVKRIRWLGSPDPTWSREDGRPTTAWAVSQALALVEHMADTDLPYDFEPQVTATARGGIEFVWKSSAENELDVVVPADPGQPIEVACIRRRSDGSISEEERDVSSVDEAVAFVTRV